MEGNEPHRPPGEDSSAVHTSITPRRSSISVSNTMQRMSSIFHSESSTSASSSKPPRKLSDRLAKSNFFNRDNTSAAFSCATGDPTPQPGQHQRRNTNVPITNLMTTIQPGQQIQRGVPRSSTTGNLGQHLTASGKQGGPTAHTPSFMRPTSSSAARQSSSIPVPSTGRLSAVRQTSAIPAPTAPSRASARRPSVGQPTIPRTHGNSRHRLSSSITSLGTRPEANSDLPFRRIYGSDAPASKDNTDTVSNTSHVTEDNLLPDIPSRGSAEETPKPPKELFHSSKFFTNPDPDTVLREHYPKWMEQTKHVKPQMLEMPPTPPTNADDADREREAAAYRRFLGIPTPKGQPSIDQAEMERMIEEDKKLQTHVPQELLDSVMFSDKEPLSVKQGKQREATGVNGKAKDTSNANGKQRERVDFSEGDTVIYGGKGDADTGLLSADEIDFEQLNQAYDEDPRNVSRCFHLLEASLLPPPSPTSLTVSLSTPQIYEAKPSAFWSGRFSGMGDRFRNEALTAVPLSANHPMMDDGLRLRRIYKELHGFCKTPAAQQSLYEYALAYKRTYGIAAPLNQLAVAPKEAAKVPEQAASQGSDKKKKGGVLGRLASMSLRRKSGV